MLLLMGSWRFIFSGHGAHRPYGSSESDSDDDDDDDEIMFSDEEDEPEQGQEFSLLCLLIFLILHGSICFLVIFNWRKTRLN